MKSDTKMFYCITGGIHLVVVDADVTEYDGLYMAANKCYNIQAIPGVTSHPTLGKGIQLIVNEFRNCKMKCDFISDLDENSDMYKVVRGKITGISTV